MSERAPRLDLVAHIREQIERDPEAYANSKKLGACVGKLLADVKAYPLSASVSHVFYDDTNTDTE